MIAYRTSFPTCSLGKVTGLETAIPTNGSRLHAFRTTARTLAAPKSGTSGLGAAAAIIDLASGVIVSEACEICMYEI